MQMLRISAVKAATGHKSHTSIYDAIRKGLFTTGIAISERSKAWPDYEVSAINMAYIAGQSKSEIIELVNRLHAKRKALVQA